MADCDTVNVVGLGVVQSSNSDYHRKDRCFPQYPNCNSRLIGEISQRLTHQLVGLNTRSGTCRSVPPGMLSSGSRVRERGASWREESMDARVVGWSVGAPGSRSRPPVDRRPTDRPTARAPPSDALALLPGALQR